MGQGRAGLRNRHDGGFLVPAESGVADVSGAVQSSPEALGRFRSLVALLGAAFIYLLMRLFGRTVRESDAPWLSGPIGGDYIGDKPYEEVAAREQLVIRRRAEQGGLVPDLGVLAAPDFDVARLRPEIRDFYENTAAYRMDVWSETFFPANIGLWLLVTTISRKFNQLNFPLRALATAKGLDSEIVLLRDLAGKGRYAGWYRRLVDTGHVIYTGFYMTERVPLSTGSCVKVVFPMPGGSATVILKPSLDAEGNLLLSSKGRAFGDAGFYRLRKTGGDRLLVWRVSTLHEHFRVYLEADTLRCDHRVSFLGLPVLHLHYRIERKHQANSSLASGT
jgi:hypothetical protein